MKNILIGVAILVMSVSSLAATINTTAVVTKVNEVSTIDKTENDNLQVNVELYKENKKSGRKVIFKAQGIAQNNKKFVFDNTKSLMYVSSMTVTDTQNDEMETMPSENADTSDNENIVNNATEDTSENASVAALPGANTFIPENNQSQVNLKTSELKLGYIGFITPNVNDKTMQLHIDNSQLIKSDQSIQFIQLPTIQIQSVGKILNYQLGVPTIIALKDGVKMKVTINNINKI